MRKIAFFLVVIASLAGCAATYPRDPVVQGVLHVNEARKAFVEGDASGASYHVENAVIRPNGLTLLREMFATTPNAKPLYLKYLDDVATKITSIYDVRGANEKIAAAKASGLLTEQEINKVSTKLNASVLTANQSGSIPFTLSDNFETIPVLQEPAQQLVIVQRSISILQAPGKQARDVPGLIAYAKRSSPEERARISALLPTLNLKLSELDAVSVAFPEYAITRKIEITTKAHIEFKNADRLVADDITAVVKNRIKGVEWVAAPGQGVTVVMVEKVRHDERPRQEQTHTITYAQYQVNLFQAALLMPRNATYMYDLSIGGVEMDYGYVVSATMGGKKIYEEVVRGKINTESRSCKNARIQNVFGGVQPADFVANDDMQERCNGQGLASADELRKGVYGQVAERILLIPTIKANHDSN